MMYRVAPRVVVDSAHPLPLGRGCLGGSAPAHAGAAKRM